MKVLLDTNIVIHRETNRIVRDDIGILFHWLDRLKYDKLVHPASIAEIQSHKDPEVVKTMTVKLGSYNIIQAVPATSAEVLRILAPDDITPNDKTDTIILNALYLDIADLFITEDRKLRAKAKRLGLETRVFSIEQFLEKATAENPQFRDYKVMSVRRMLFGHVDLSDRFFDSFRADYVGFDKWFRKKNDETVYVCLEDGNVVAFLYLKVEGTDDTYPDISPKFEKKKRLKIGTFKVVLNGYKLGERFVKVVFDNAIEQGCEEIYVTIFSKSLEQIRLIELLQEYGFEFHGRKISSSGEESVYVRKLKRDVDLSFPKRTFPFVSKRSRTFLVPIYPEYHTELFPDSILRTESPADFVENEPYRNAISKVYISRSIFRDLKPGDNVVFYRTGGYYESVLSTIGIVESIHKNIPDEKTFLDLCGKRSVFSPEELKKHWNYTTNRPFIVNFLYVYSFPRRINLKKMIELSIVRDLNSAPRGFELISNEQFSSIISETKTNESLIVD